MKDEGGVPADGDFGGEEPSGGNNGGNGDSDDGAGQLPPEEEETIAFQRPQAGATSVYIPNPLTNRVAIVNAKDFAIETVRAGEGPTYTATVSGKDVAIVLNVGSRDATILSTQAGKTSTTTVPVGYAANAIAIAPDAAHAVVYFDARNPKTQADSFQDVTVLDLSAEPVTSRGVSVGFRPKGVLFSQDGQRAFVITEDGISVIELAKVNQGQAIARIVGVGDTLKDTSLATDISITPDGTFAIARKENASLIRLINLETGAIQTLDLKALQSADATTTPAKPLASGTLEITDLDLAPSGAFALAMARSHGAMIRIPVPGGFTDPSNILVTKIEDQLVGSAAIAPTGQLAVLYTTSSNVEGIVLVDLFAGGAPRGVRLRKTVRAIAISEDGTRVFVLHDRSGGASTSGGIDEETRIDRSEGYSLVDTTTGFAKLQLTSTAVSAEQLVVTNKSERMFVLLRDDAKMLSAVQTADLSSFQIDTIELVAPPSSIGLVPQAERVFIGQELSGGMITFLDWKTGNVEKAVTGFELTSRIRQ